VAGAHPGTSLQLTVTVLGNSTATVYVPLAATGATKANAPRGAQSLV
jgi:hypothetical protein